jgi:hypothetical protein
MPDTEAGGPHLPIAAAQSKSHFANPTCAWPLRAQGVGEKGCFSTLQRSRIAAPMDAGPE